MRQLNIFISCVAILILPSAAPAATSLTTTRIATGLSRPLFVTAPPGDTSRIFIVEQQQAPTNDTADIHIYDLNSSALLATPFLTVTDVRDGGNEQGLLGLAFHPDYASNGKFYVNYTSESRFGDTVIAEYTVSGNPNLADASSRRIILVIDQPASNHNAGWIGFGPHDGYLYIPTGDGGGGCDSQERAQDLDLLLGKVLRIDVDDDEFPGDSEKNYAIPPDNPFARSSGADEIFDYGLRNPYRCGFDRLTGDLYIGDVGQLRREEVSFHAAGEPGGINFGWDCMEGTFCSDIPPSNCTVNGCTCNDPALTLPIHDYNRVSTSRQAVTGGLVYRGCAIPDLRGTYFFADYASAEIWSFKYDGVNAPVEADRTAELVPPLGQGSINSISSFGEDAEGELYICDLFGGEVFKIVPDGAVDAPTPHDYDNDGNVTIDDLERFDACLSGPAVMFDDCLCDVFNTASASGAFIDLRDFAGFQEAFGN